MNTRRISPGTAVFAAILSLCLAAGAAAQTRALFSIDDIFKVASIRLEDVTVDGRWLACTLSTLADRLPSDNARYGDPTYVAPAQSDLIVLGAASGAQVRLFPRKEQIRSVVWSPDGRRLAVLLYRKPSFQIRIWNRDGRKFEAAAFQYSKAIAANSPLLWTSDGTRLLIALRAEDWEARSAELYRNVTAAPIMLFDTEKPFLPWDEVSRRARLVIPATWDPAANKVAELLPEGPIGSARLTKNGKYLLFERDVTEKTNYDVIGGTRNQLEALPLAGGPARVLLKPYDQRSISWSKDGLWLAYAEKGDIFVMGVEDKEPRNLTAEKEPTTGGSAAPAPAAKEPAKEDAKKKPAFAVVRFSPDGASILATSARPQPESPDKSAPPSDPPRQYWLIEARGGSKAMIHEQPEKEEDRPGLQIVDWSPDGGTIYFATAATDKYDRGLVKLDVASKKMSDLVRSGKLYSRWRMAEDGSRFLYAESDGDRPEDLYAADADFSKTTRLTDLNPGLKGIPLSHAELVSYLDADGKKLYGVLYYPAGYEKGRKYPLITEVYESYFENGFNATLNVFAAAGYAVLHPSVNFTPGYPGEAWGKGALAAVNKVVDMGVADPERLGIQGTSYGGYATVLLLTQTDRFKAAINNSGKVDMLSFYTQSPRLGVRNTHAPEKSQDRLGGTLWEYPERYIAHSAVLQADRIKTPLLCITGDQDPNVEASQSQEIFYALRRLGKKAVWLRYHDGAHGGPNTNDERRDMYKRMLAWYDAYLKPAAAAPAAK
jgi:dipeptidyl aminopeptidase/acylaminoacyl peptidase